MFTDFLVDLVAEETKLVLSIVEFSALALEVVAGVNFISAFVVAEHAEAIFGGANFFGDATEVTMWLLLKSAELLTEVRNLQISIAVVGDGGTVQSGSVSDW